MDSRIGATAADDRDSIAFDLGERFLETLLD
jgi:hypothetical protein